MKALLKTLLLCLVCFYAKAQIVIKNVTIDNAAALNPVQIFFIVKSLDSVQLTLSKNDYDASHTYQNILWLNLNTTANIDTLVGNITSTLYQYDYSSTDINCGTAGTTPACVLQTAAPTAAAYTNYALATKTFLKNKLLDIKNQLLTASVQDGALRINTPNRASQLIFHYSLSKRGDGQIMFSLIENATMNGNSSTPGLNSFGPLFAEDAVQIGNQVYNVLLSAKGSAVLNDSRDFYDINVSTLNDIALQVKKIKGTYIDFTGGDRHGYIKVNTTIPLYEDTKDAIIDFENVKEFIIQTNDAGDVALLKNYPFYPSRWKFVPDDVNINPKKGKFFLRKDVFSDEISTAHTATTVDLLTDKIGKRSLIKEGNKQIGTIAVDSVDIQITDGEIYSFSFWIKNGVNNTAIDRYQYYNVRYRMKELSKSYYKFYALDNYLILGQDKNNPYWSHEEFLIHPADLIFFDHPDQLSNKIWTSIDTVYRFRTTNNQLGVAQQLKEKGLMSIVTLDLFGDLTGFLSEGKPNGLLQSELKFRTFLVRQPFRSKFQQRSRFYWLNSIDVRARASKIDNKNKFLPLLSDIKTNTDGTKDTTKYAHTSNLYSYQNFVIDAKLTLFNWDFGAIQWLGYAKAGLLISNFQDTIYSASVTTDQSNGNTNTTTSIDKKPLAYGFTSLQYSYGTTLRFLRTHDINIDFDFEALCIKPTKQSVQLSQAEYNPDVPAKNKYVAIDKNRAWLWHPKLALTFNVDAARTRRVIATAEYITEVKQPGNNNFFLQIGYSADLNRFLNLNKPAGSN